MNGSADTSTIWGCNAHGLHESVAEGLIEEMPIDGDTRRGGSAPQNAPIPVRQP